MKIVYSVLGSLLIMLVLSACNNNSGKHNHANDLLATNSQGTILDLLLNPFIRMLDLQIKLESVLTNLDYSQNNQDILNIINNKDAQYLWKMALGISLNEDYIKFQSLEINSVSLEQRLYYETKKIQSIRNRSYAYGLYLLKVYYDFNNKISQENIDFCKEFNVQFKNEDILYAIGNIGINGVMFEPIDNESLKNWILQDNELNAMYNIISINQSNIIKAYQYKCK